MRKDHPTHGLAAGAVKQLLADGQTLCCLPRNIREFWNVCTRLTERNGLGFPHEVEEEEVRNIVSIFQLLDDGPDIHEEWRRMVSRHRVSGVQVQDCYIAASMAIHKVENILTFNTADFVRYPVTVIDPISVE